MKNMNSYFKECLDKGKIRPFSRGKILVSKETKLAFSDLQSAKKSFEEGNYKWSIIQTYYSMFHSARALLYAQNFREKSHFCLIEAIRAFYVEKRILNFEFVEALQKAKNLREEADYYGEFSKDNAGDLLKKATEFLKQIKIILGKLYSKNP